MARYDELFELIDGAWWDVPPAELDDLQIRAAAEYFEHRRAEVKLLDRRALDTGVDGIKSRDDIVPLLFSHTTYKSYPMSFVERGQWVRLTQWLATLAAKPIEGADLDGVENIDQWVSAMEAVGHRLVVTSGTSGKCSFLDHSPRDLERLRRGVRATTGWPDPLVADNSRRFYGFGPRTGWQKGTLHWQFAVELFADPSAVRYLTDEPITVGGIMKSGALRKAMMQGTVPPDELRKLEVDAQHRAGELAAAMDALVDDILDHHADPMIIAGMWAQIYQVVDVARRKKGNVSFSPLSYVISGGGRKSADIPPDFMEQIFAVLAPARHTKTYGMSELGMSSVECEAGNYHRPPWVVLLLLDDTGEALIEPTDGVATGRAGFLDMTFDGRWGGVITGDRISVDFADRCACGRPGPVILPAIGRYTDGGGDDKLGCAGTFDQYMRGMLGV